MSRTYLQATWMGVVLIGLGLSSPLASAQDPKYPETRKVEQVDTYHGVKVADPYRWLEDDRSEETTQWVKAEDEITFSYLDKIPYRAQVMKRLEQLFNYPRYTAPFRRSESYFFFKNDGLQNQNVLYVQKGLEGTPELLLDPNKFSADGTSRLLALDISKDGQYCAYGVSTGGSDWEEAHVMEVATRKVLSDDLKWLKFTGLAWAGKGFFYSRFDEPAAGHELTTKNENEKIYYHRMGTSQSADELIYEDEANPERLFNVDTTEDERFAILNVADRGKGKRGNAVFYRDLSRGEKTFTPIVAEISDDTFEVIDNVGGKFLIRTNRKAPNYRVALYNPATPDSAWSDVLPEKPEELESAATAGGKLFATYLKDVKSRSYVHSLDGKRENEINLPGAGTAFVIGGNHDDKIAFFSFTSLNFPPTIFRYDIASKEAKVFRTPEIPGFKPDDYETKEVFYKSKDGTRVPMFLVYKKRLKLDGTNPTLLYGYGGFNVTNFPTFNALRLTLLEQGFVYASANMRGGEEYGEKWHEAGTKLQKQNVFDDFIAAAEWLIANKYATPQHLAIIGGSNGGLLVGAVMNQRPELFRAGVPQVGVMDMLRFQKFTIGSAWIADYGSSDNAGEFKALYAYSPLHNIRAGAKYPAMLITTADHDDRVVPAHSFKYAATMQALASHDNPVLIRIDTNSGHGASSTTKNLELTRDIYSFLFYNLGVTPRF
ncbi:MAG TPA: prolyl oligopeptidase family serine peptidase [Candidatus Acidoferrum sp.]|nr:prolyl oligopeptidase family serine peptidase [Candidatus Acidoferrum sp.]